VFDLGSTSERKNPLAAVRAVTDGFGERDDVVLVLKFHSSRHEPGFLARLNGEVRGLRNVMILPGELSEAEMARLRQICDCLISPHRSEGFGLNIAEFMALGKPVIATRYSGNLDYFDADVGYPVDYRLVEVKTTCGPYAAGSVWAEPNVASLAAQMRAVIDDPMEAGRRGARAAARIGTLFNHAAIGNAMRARFKSINLDAEPVRFLGWLGRSPTRAVFRSQPFAAPRCPTDRLDLLTAFSVIVPVFDVPGPLLERCIRSVLGQSYTFWELCLCNDGSTRADTLEVLERYRGSSLKIKIRDLPGNAGIAAASNAAAEMAVGDFLVLLDHDDELAPDALWEAASAISARPRVDCLYSDEDKINEAGEQIEHFFKPDWSPEHLESVMYVLHMLVIRKSLFYEVGGFRAGFDGAQDYDLMLRCARATDNIHHIARVLYHWRAIPGSSAEQVDAKPYALAAGLRALQDHAIRKYGSGARAEPGLTPGTFRLRRPLCPPPRVTLLILTNNVSARLPGRGKVRLVDNFVDSILRHTAYPDYEIVVVDNSTLDKAQLARFRKLSVRVENWEPEAGFNFAAKANYAVSCAGTEHVVILNDDMEVISPGWLEALMELSQDLQVGVVGARLLHFDGTIQHAGMVLGVNGAAAHAYHSFPGQFVGYNAFTHVIRNYSAVTGACLATKRSILAQVGGFDEAFAIDFNDVDLCLRIGKAGYRVVYTPFAELYHLEHASAPRQRASPGETQRFQARWAEEIGNDPFYNPNLARDRLDYAQRAPLPGFRAAAE
jgi:GT2 family glycosyltransferase